MRKIENQIKPVFRIMMAATLLLLTGGYGAGALNKADTACGILTPGLLVTAINAVVGGFEPSEQSAATFSSCTYVWASEVELTREIAGQIMTYKAENRVTLTLSIFEGEATGAFAKSTGTLKQNREYQDIEDVGDEA